MGLIKRRVILAKGETTYNTDPTPTGVNDAVLVENFQWGFHQQKMYDNNPLKSTLGRNKHLYGGALVQLTFDALIKGYGAAGTAPEIGPILKACGMSENTVALTSVTYKPTSSSIASCTIYLYEDGKLYKFTGCRGNVALTLEASQPGKAKFTMIGHFVSVTDTAIATPTYDAPYAVPIVSGGFSADSYSAVIKALAVDLGNQVAMPPSLSAADAFGEVRITNRDVKGSFDPEDVLKATYDFIAKWQAGAAFTVQTGVIGGTAGNRFQLTMPAVSYRDAKPADRDGIAVFDMGFGAAESSGDDELSLIYT